MAWLYGTFWKVLLKFTKCHLVVHALVSWTTILRFDGLVTMDGYYSCTLYFCWVSFLAKLFGRGLVMDDHFGQTKFNSIPISCPFVLVSSMLLLAWHVVVFHWLRGSPGSMSGWSEIKGLRCWHMRNLGGLPVVSFRSLKKNRHMAHSNWFMSFQCPTLLTINRTIPFLPSHISHIFFSDISCPVLCLKVSFSL